MFKNGYRAGILLVVINSIVVSGCASTPRLSEAELITSSIKCLQTNNVLIMAVPSRGVTADFLSIQAAKKYGNDGGFKDDFINAVTQGNNNFSVYSRNADKSSVYLEYALKHYQDNELKAIKVCMLNAAVEKYPSLINEAKRTGVSLFDNTEKSLPQ